MSIMKKEKNVSKRYASWQWKTNKKRLHNEEREEHMLGLVPNGVTDLSTTSCIEEQDQVTDCYNIFFKNLEIRSCTRDIL